ncbi:neurofilament heavy polypeptide isoform X2 [Mastacembelus armatus]|uniref:Uncharacterized LOC113146282 n=1 Tax=Mastacembelus armatus TaxID=205130 RepID=A0A7N8XWU1_9TELE|nr:neurofilament heavy polypeptide-like isoform X2 [Mastacembelus armatus]
MTAKHRKGKGNQKHEDNFFKNEVMESEARTGGNNYTLLVVLLLFVIGGATGAWFCFQQHQTLTYLTDSLMGLQMKIVKLQSSHEDMRQSSSKHISESLESRMNALEESYALAQKQVGMALATAEQLKTSDLPAQVLSLHTEMKARLAEMQQATVSLEQLSQLQSQLKGKSEEFEGVKIQIEGLATLSAELSQRVELLTGSQAETESELEERFGQVTTLSNALDGQAADVLTLREQLDAYQAQLEASTLEMAAVRELFESEQSQPAHQPNMEDLLNMLHQNLQEQNAAATSLHSELRAQLENVQKQVTQLVGGTQPPGETVEQTDEETVATAQEQSAAATQEEKEGLPSDVKKEAFNPEEEAEAEQREAAAQDEAPVEQEFTETEDPAPAEEVEAVKEVQTEQYGSLAKSAKKKVKRRQPGDKGQSVEEDVPIEKNVKAVEEGKTEGQQIEEEESLVEAEKEKLSEREEAREDNHKAEEERVSEREEVDDALASEGEKGLEKSLLHEEKLNVEEEVAELQEEQEDVAAEVETDDTDKEEELLANYSLPEDK